MKVGGKQAGVLPTRMVRVTRGGDDVVGAEVFEFKVTGLPFGSEEETARLLPGPKMPMRQATKDGKLARDHKGLPIMEPDPDDPEYVAETKRVNRLQSVRLLYLSLKGDPAVEFEATRDTCQSEEEFCEKILAELRAFPLTMGEVLSLVHAMQEISGMSREELEAARAAFFQRAR